jgi:hypothetical protein
MSEAGSKKKQKITRSVGHSVAVAPSVAPVVAKAAVNTTWAAWKSKPSVAVRVVISHIKYGGIRGDKKPSWMLMIPIGDVEMRRYT